MSIYKDNKKGWRYQFQYLGIRYNSKHYQTKSDALSARECAKRKAKLEQRTNIIRIETDFTNYDLSTQVNTLDALKAKYAILYQNPDNTVASLFEMVMIDIGIPVRFDQVVDCIKVMMSGKNKKISASLRVKILSRDSFTCKMCGRTPPDVKLCIDHIIPISKGGITEERNLQSLCQECNMGKSNLHIKVKK